MLERIIQDTFWRIGHLWSIGKEYRAPEDHDIRQVLDEAAAVLYNEDIGARLETGGLIIEKTPNGYDVYVYVGDYT